MSVVRRREMIDAQHKDLSMTRQCRLLHISRSGLYYDPVGESALNLALMRMIDEQYLKCPWYGSRQMTRHLKRQGYCVGRKRIRRLMRQMGLMAICPGPHTSRRHTKHPVFPYLLGNLSVTRANQVPSACSWFCVSGGDHGLAYKACSFLASLDDSRHQFLS